MNISNPNPPHPQTPTLTKPKHNTPKAADLFATESSASEANKCRLKVAELSAELERCARGGGGRGGCVQCVVPLVLLDRGRLRRHMGCVSTDKTHKKRPSKY